MIAIVDYGVGNLFSLKSSFEAINENVVVTSDTEIIKKADKIILPGVGAFSDSAKRLKETGLGTIIVEEAKNGKPILGICLGMQLLFKKSYEFGEYDGLGLLDGEIVPMEGAIPKELKIPHIGWNKLCFKKTSSKLFKYINDGDFVYFVHSFYATRCDLSVCAVTDYGIPITACVEAGNIFGCQFHPEKSGRTGLNILKAFCDLEVD